MHDDDAALERWWSTLDPASRGLLLPLGPGDPIPPDARAHLHSVIRGVGTSAWRLGDHWIPYRLGTFLATKRDEVTPAEQDSSWARTAEG